MINYHPLDGTPMQPQGSGRWHQLPTDHDAGVWKRRRERWKEMNHEEGDSTRHIFFFFFLFNCIHSQNACTKLCTLFLFFFNVGACFFDVGASNEQCDVLSRWSRTI